MNATQQLHNAGQSLWLDNITRGLLTSGTLARYIEEWSVTGLTSNPTIFDNAIAKTAFYDDAIHQKTRAGQPAEELFFDLALEETLAAFAEHGHVGRLLPRDGGNADAVIDQFERAGTDVAALAARLQEEGAQAFVQSWDDLLARIAQKGEQLQAAVQQAAD